MSSTETEPRPSSNILRLLHSPMVTVQVGPDKHDFGIHKALICHYSRFFERAFSGPFLESKTNTVVLEDVPVVLFKLFVNWLYYDDLIYVASDSNSSIMTDFDSLEVVDDIEDLEEYERGECEVLPRVLADDAKTWHYIVLIKLYILADRFDAPHLGNVVLDTILQCYQSYLPDNVHIRYAFRNSTRQSELRKLLVECSAYRLASRGLSAAFETLPFEFVCGVLAKTIARSPSLLCDYCYKSARVENKIDCHGDLDGRHDGSGKLDQFPYEKDPCIFHKHIDDEERKACREKREKKKT